MSPTGRLASSSVLSRRIVRGALLLAALLLLVGAFASSAGAAVYWSNFADPFAVPPVPGTISRANLDGSGVNQAFISAQSGSVASDGVHLYWTDGGNHSIGRANVDGTGVNRNFIPGVTGSAIAVDAAHIYWDSRDGSIGRANLDGTGVNQTFIPQVGAVFGVAVDRAHVYWTTGGSIGRANLDGTAPQNFFAGDGGFFDQPIGVAVDAGHVYWANALGTIGRVDLNGLNADPNFIVRAAPAGDETRGVAVDSAHVYWTHDTLNPPDPGDGIGRANLDGTGVNPTFISTAQPAAIAVDAAGQAATPSHISIGDVRMAEGNSGQTAFRFNVSLDQPQAGPVTVQFATADGTATAPSDYAASQGTVTFAPGETTQTVTVQVNGDTTVEPDETFNVNLANATGNATIADGQGVGTIVNDDQPVVVAPSRISIDDVRMAEGNAGQTAFRFTVSLDQAQAAPVTVDFTTANGTATSPSDFVPTRGTVTFAPGETTKAVVVQVNGDTAVEPDETFNVNLSNATGNAAIADAQGVGTIVNDDQPVIVPPSRISIGDVRMAEGNAAQTAFQFTVSLDQPQTAPVTVDFATADGTATAPSDYAATTGTVTFAPGETTKTVTVQVNGDTTVEPDETFSVNLANATGNATITDGQGVGTIVNDDQPVVVAPSRISIGDVRMAEGNAGQTAFQFTVSLDQPQTAPVTVDFATANGTATAPSDYAASTGTVTFVPGETAKPVTVEVNGDTRKEPDETFNVNLANATGNATITDGQGVGTIVNDDRRHALHRFTLGENWLNHDTGTAWLAVTVPGPGRLAISGDGVKRGGVVAARSASAAGTLRLLITPSGQDARTLNRVGQVMVNARVTYTPIGGTPTTRSKNIRLEKR